MPRWYTRPKTVTHPSANRARRALTSFIRRTPLYTPLATCAATHSLQVGEFRLSCTVWFGAGLPCRRLSAGWRLWTEISAIRWATCLLCATSEQHVRRSILRGGWAACMEWAAVQSTWLSLTVFNAHLKTHLFSISCGATAHLWHLWFLCAAYKCTYLLTYLLYLSGARCRLAYGPADATATHCLLFQ